MSVLLPGSSVAPSGFAPARPYKACVGVAIHWHPGAPEETAANWWQIIDLNQLAPGGSVNTQVDLDIRPEQLAISPNGETWSDQLPWVMINGKPNWPNGPYEITVSLDDPTSAVGGAGGLCSAAWNYEPDANPGYCNVNWAVGPNPGSGVPQAHSDGVTMTNTRYCEGGAGAGLAFPIVTPDSSVMAVPFLQWNPGC